MSAIKRYENGSDMPTYVTQGMEIPLLQPAEFEPTTEDDIKFDPSKHLALEEPKWIRPLIKPGMKNEFQFPVAPGDKNFPGLAFSAPFKLLSDEGVAAMRKIIKRNEKYAMSNERQPKCIRGLGYRSKFATDLAYDPSLLKLLSNIAGDQIWPEDHSMNIPQINFGEIGGSRPVDKWHLDSVPYVVVLILSDLRDMEGGDLQVARLEDPLEALELVRKGELPKEKIEEVQYPGMGYAILMQGSRIAHCVTPVKSGREPRLTNIMSFQSKNVFAPDPYVYNTFVKAHDPSQVLQTEHSRHVAWRVKGQMEYLIKNPQYQSPHNMVKIISHAAAELKKAEQLMKGEIVDQLPYKSDDPNLSDRARSKKKVDTARHAAKL